MPAIEAPAKTAQVSITRRSPAYWRVTIANPPIIPVKIPFDMPYGPPISLAQARTGTHAGGIGH
jgi:hypothetical protein